MYNQTVDACKDLWMHEAINTSKARKDLWMHDNQKSFY